MSDFTPERIAVMRNHLARMEVSIVDATASELLDEIERLRAKLAQPCDECSRLRGLLDEAVSKRKPAAWDFERWFRAQYGEDPSTRKSRQPWSITDYNVWKDRHAVAAAAVRAARAIPKKRSTKTDHPAGAD